MNQTFMKEKKVIPLVFSMSMPMVLSMLVNSLFNIVDSYFVAKVSEAAMTALSLVYPAQLVVTAVSVGFGVGINVLIAFYMGAAEKDKANIAASLGTALSLLHGILTTVVYRIIMPHFLGMFTTDSEVLGLGIVYANIAFAFAPIVTVGITYEKIFQAVGRMKVSMISMMVGFIANIILDPLMIFGIGPFPRMETAGAAWATGIGQVLTLLCYFGFYFCRPIPVKINLQNVKWDSAIAGRLYSVGVPAALNMALSSVLLSVINGILSVFGQGYVLVFGAYYKLQSFIYLPVSGIIQGIRPLVGYNYGAGEHKRVTHIFYTALVMAVVIMTAGTILCWAVPGWLIGLFTTNPDTIVLGIDALRMISLGFIISAVSVTCQGALEGLAKGTPSLVISLARYLFLIIPAAFILSRVMQSANGVWLAFPVTEVIAAVISVWVYKRRHHDTEG